jgi:hypothetical protein
VVANPIDPVPCKSKEFCAKLAESALPLKDPLNPAVEVTDPLNTAGPILIRVPEPETIRLPVIMIADPLTVNALLPVIELDVLK